MPATVSTRKPATCKPLIVSTTPLSEGSRCIGSFVFSDGATVRSNGGLVCSQHGHRHCTHHQLAHDLIVTTAASQEAATTRCKECGDALRADQHDYCDWCAGIMPALRTNAGRPLSDAAADALLDELLTEAAMEAAEAYDADYDAWLDIVDATLPLPAPQEKQEVHAPQPAPQPATLAPDDDGADFPLLMNVEAEVARVEAEMEAAGFIWNGDTWERCWVRAQRGC